MPNVVVSLQNIVIVTVLKNIYWEISYLKRVPRFSTQNTTSQNALVTNEKVKNGVRAIKCNASSSIDLNINRNIGEIAARLEWWMYIPSQSLHNGQLKQIVLLLEPLSWKQNGLCKVGTGTMTNPTFSNIF